MAPMIRSLAFSALLVGGALGAPAFAADTPRAERAELRRCAEHDLPRAYCIEDPDGSMVLDGIWRAARERLEDESSDLSFSRDPGSEGYGQPIEGVSLADATHFDEDDPEPRSPRWVFVRRSISTRDIGALADRTDDTAPNVGALAATLPLGIDFADIETCPGLRARLDALEPLLTLQIDVPSVGRDADITPLTTFDGYLRILHVRGRLADGTMARVEYEMDDAQPLAQWQADMFDLLRQCWRPAPPEFR